MQLQNKMQHLRKGSENKGEELNFDISREMSKGETDADDGCGNKAMIYMKIVNTYVTRSIVFSFSICSIWELRSQHEEGCRHLKEECRHLEEQLRLKNDTYA
nr:hypothetical protein [Tanacetum cinerariifolium]